MYDIYGWWKSCNNDRVLNTMASLVIKESKKLWHILYMLNKTYLTFIVSRLLTIVVKANQIKISEESFIHYHR